MTKRALTHCRRVQARSQCYQTSWAPIHTTSLSQLDLTRKWIRCRRENSKSTNRLLRSKMAHSSLSNKISKEWPCSVWKATAREASKIIERVRVVKVAAREQKATATTKRSSLPKCHQLIPWTSRWPTLTRTWMSTMITARTNLMIALLWKISALESSTKIWTRNLSQVKSLIRRLESVKTSTLLIWELSI